jgi:hypothetical protein
VTLWRRLTRIGSAGAAALTVHALVNLRSLRVPEDDPPPVPETVSVLLPVRDEERRVRSCLVSLLDQVGVDRLEVLVLDDGSSDRTAQIVREIAATDPRVRLLSGGDDVPAGWLGKTWACHRLAGEASGTALVFVDADVRFAPHAIAAAVALLRRSGLDLVSPYPRQLAATFGERLVQPLLQWSFLSTLPLRAAERSARPSLSAANGQFLAVDAATYARAGGHATVRGEVLDDVALLRAVKRAGGRGVVVDGTRLATCRMYADWPDLREGYTKSLWSAFGSPQGAAVVVGGLAVCYVVPPLAALRGSLTGLGGYVAAVVGRYAVAERTGGRSLPDSLAHPASVVVLGWLTARSWRARNRGELTWRGRPVRPAAMP